MGLRPDGEVGAVLEDEDVPPSIMYSMPYFDSGNSTQVSGWFRNFESIFLIVYLWFQRDSETTSFGATMIECSYHEHHKSCNLK